MTHFGMLVCVAAVLLLGVSAVGGRDSSKG